MAGWSTLTSGVVGIGVGEAGAAAIEPVLEPLRQDAWAKSKANLLALGTLAQLVAQGLIEHDTLLDDVHRLGFTEERFDAEIQLALVAAPISELLELWRRGLLGEPTSAEAIAKVDHGLAKAQIEPQYWPAIKELFVGRLDPSLIATMVQRDVLPNAADPDTGERLLPVSAEDAAQQVYDEWNAATEAQLGTAAPSGHNVPPMPRVAVDPITEARAHGIDFKRLAAETRIVGLPASPDLAARMVFRGIATPADFVQAMAEGNARIEWSPALFAAFREILTAGQYAELQLRGYLTRDQRLAETLKHGMAERDSDLLYDLLGRGLSLHAAFIAERRGGVFEGDTKDIPAWAMFQLQRGNLRPEVYNLAWAGRHSLPSPFVIRALLTDGAISRDYGETLYLHMGWPEDLAKLTADHYGKATAAKADPHVVKADTHLWNTVHASYKAEEATATDVGPALTLLGLDAASQAAVLKRWDAERALIRAQLSPSDLRKAYQESIVNPATGAGWTQADALAQLLDRGWSHDDAMTYLLTPYKG